MAYVVHEFQSGEVLMAGQLNEMDAQIASNESAASDRSYIAAAYSVAPYSKGSLVVYGGEIWEAVVDITVAEAWNSVHWKRATLNDRLKEQDQMVVVQDATPSSYVTKVWLPATPPSGIQVPTYSEFEDMDDEITDLKTAKAPCVYSTASGAIASFADGADGMPIKSLIVGIDPVQDLHGYDSPWPAGGGKNLCPPITLPLTSGTVLREFPEEITLTALSLQFRFSGSFSNVGGSFLVGKDANGTSTFAITPGYMKKVSDNTTLIANTTYNNEAVALSTTSLGASGKLKQLLFYNYPSFTDGVFTDLMLEDSSTPTAYSPYSNICPISGHESATVTRTGVNVWDEEWELGQYDNTTGQPISANNCIRTKNPISVKPNTTYYTTYGDGNIQVFFYRSDDTYISQTWIGAITSNVITTPAGCEKMRFRLASTYGTTYNNNISINYPVTDHDYHAHAIQSVTIQLGQTVYGGTLDAVAGKLTIDRAIDTLNDKTLLYADGSNISYRKDYSERAKYSDSYTGLVCSCFPASDGYSSYVRWRGSAQYRLTFVGSNMDTLSSLCDAGTLQVSYMIATPVSVDLTPQGLETLKGVNNVFSDSGDVSVEYPADTKLYIDKKLAELQALILENI